MLIPLQQYLVSPLPIPASFLQLHWAVFLNNFPTLYFVYAMPFCVYPKTLSKSN
uniref:Uncharacterized protein n=1 Tax=Chlorocebus sabaeus TaxID=60711 RepID=A0A0D9SDI1_CHLSB